MISLTYQVTCDGPHHDLPDEGCEAEFEVVVDGRFTAIAILRRQLDGRGWRCVLDDDGNKFYCPLHLTPAAAGSPETGGQPDG